MSSAVSRPFVLQCAPSAREFLLEEGTDSKFGARHLKRSIERHVVFPLSSLLATGQIELGDLVTLDFDRETAKLTVRRQKRGALVEIEEKLDSGTKRASAAFSVWQSPAATMA
jgi:hypothetical protein